MIIPAMSPFQDRTGAGAGSHGGVFSEAAGRLPLRREPPFCAPFVQFRIGHEQVELPCRSYPGFEAVKLRDGGPDLLAPIPRFGFADQPRDSPDLALEKRRRVPE